MISPSQLLLVQSTLRAIPFLKSKVRSQAITTPVCGVFVRRASIPYAPSFVNPVVIEGDVKTEHVPPSSNQKVQGQILKHNKSESRRKIVNNPKYHMNLRLPYPGKLVDIPADFVVVDYVPDEQIPLILGRPFLRTARALIDVYDEKLILRDGNESLTLNMQSEKSKLNGIQKVESINMIDIFNVPNYIGFKDLFAQMYSGSSTIQSNDSFPSSSPIKTSDSTFEEFTDEFTLPNSLPPGDDVSILKKDFQEETFQITSNSLFEFNDSFKSSNVNPLFEENNKDVEIKSSSSSTLTHGCK
ncbi:reverse transcriptase domain-containing protein [Tanacetum coccineum]